MDDLPKEDLPKEASQEELQKEHHRLTGLFIEMCNTAAQESKNPGLVAAALMTSAANYCSYVSTGNAGYLSEAGIDDLTERFRSNLQVLQDIKKAEHEKAMAAAQAAEAIKKD
ncbi:hypothetical protein [Pseudoteredinibacter isoporae]|uniref:hypothetical protein n=1 Tax=Pseudoteredinibacter isoporae TaxID=570281 RepID=UPI0031061D24